MRFSVQRLVLGLPLLQPMVAGVAVPRFFHKTPFTRRDLSVNKVQQELGALVSEGSVIFGPEDARFEKATERHSTHAIPHIEVVVTPAAEEDVSEIVRRPLCNNRRGS